MYDVVYPTRPVNKEKWLQHTHTISGNAPELHPFRPYLLATQAQIDCEIDRRICARLSTMPR